MAKNLRTVMTRDEAIDQFLESYLPTVQRVYEQDGVPDYIARSESWNNYVDFLNKSNKISDWQANNWSHPQCCG